MHSWMARGLQAIYYAGGEGAVFWDIRKKILDFAPVFNSMRSSAPQDIAAIREQAENLLCLSSMAMTPVASCAECWRITWRLGEKFPLLWAEWPMRMR